MLTLPSGAGAPPGPPRTGSKLPPGPVFVKGALGPTSAVCLCADGAPWTWPPTPITPIRWGPGSAGTRVAASAERSAHEGSNATRATSARSSQIPTSSAPSGRCPREVASLPWPYVPETRAGINAGPASPTASVSQLVTSASTDDTGSAGEMSAVLSARSREGDVTPRCSCRKQSRISRPITCFPPGRYTRCSPTPGGGRRALVTGSENEDSATAASSRPAQCDASVLLATATFQLAPGPL